MPTFLEVKHAVEEFAEFAGLYQFDLSISGKMLASLSLQSMIGRCKVPCLCGCVILHQNTEHQIKMSMWHFL